MTLTQIITERRHHLLATFAKGFPPLVEVESAAGLAGLMFLDDFAPGATPDQLGRRRDQNVVVVPGPPGQPHQASLWVRQGYDGYRAAYAAFIEGTYGVKVPMAALAAYDVDHLLNRQRAGATSALLRVEALPVRSNQVWGRWSNVTSAQHRSRATCGCAA